MRRVNPELALTVPLVVALTFAAAALRAPRPLAAAPEATGELATRLQDLFAELATRVRPGVVAVGSSETVPVLDGDQEFFPRLFQDGGWELRRSALGSGVIVDARGYILTNSHVVGDGRNIRVRLWNNLALAARLVQRDEALDLALVKVDHPGLVAVPLGDSDRLLVGHWVIAVGNPFGLSQTVSAGIVSAVGRSDIGLLPYESFIQTDASIHQGNSGGPLVNLRGEVVGINTAIYSGAGGVNVGIGFAIPANIARALVSKWIAGKRAAFLGVDAMRVDGDVAAYYDLDRARGAFVSRVEKDSPAYAAGLEEKDIVLSFDGTEVRDPDHLRVLVTESDAGEPVPIEALRRGRRIFLVASLVQDGGGRDAAPLERPIARGGDDGARTMLGVTVGAVNDDVAARVGLRPDAKGIVVLEVAHDSPADEKGMRVGDLISEVNEVPVETIRQFRAALERNSRGVMLKVERGGREIGYFFLRR